LRKMCKNT